MRLIQGGNLIHIQTTKHAEYVQCEKAANELAKCIGSAIGAEETDDTPEFEASFAIGKGNWTCEDVRDVWAIVKHNIKVQS